MDRQPSGSSMKFNLFGENAGLGSVLVINSLATLELNTVKKGIDPHAWRGIREVRVRWKRSIERSRTDNLKQLRITRMGDALKACLVSNVSSVLAHLEEEQINALVDALIGKGVRKERDLRFITVSFLEETLNNFIDASELHEFWKKEYGTPVPPSSAPATTSHVRSTSSAPLRSGGGNVPRRAVGITASTSTAQMPTYEQESPHFPAAVKQAIKDKKRPSAKAREQMVERIVDHCKEIVPNLERKMFDKVALDLVTRWPESFKDTLPQSEWGHDSLAKQMRDKFDNTKRPKVPTCTEREAPALKEAFGCIQWSPQLPEGATEESLEAKRAAMVEMHQLAKKEWNWKIIKSNMLDSFYLQRKDINGKTATQSRGRKRNRSTMEEENETDALDESDPQALKVRWPFLFTCKGMNYHFKKLTGSDMRGNLGDFIKEESSLLIEFMVTKSTEMAKLRRAMTRAETNASGRTSDLTNIKVACFMLMLAKYFDNDASYLVRFVESTTSFEEVTDTAEFPEEKTPIIIAAGQTLYNSTKYFICIDGLPMMSTNNLADAFSSYFSVFFVFAIEYTEKLAAFLLYVQRLVAKISPQKGTKCSTAAIHKSANAKASKLQNKLTEFKQQLEEEEKEN